MLVLTHLLITAVINANEYLYLSFLIVEFLYFHSQKPT